MKFATRYTVLLACVGLAVSLPANDTPTTTSTTTTPSTPPATVTTTSTTSPGSTTTLPSSTTTSSSGGGGTSSYASPTTVPSYCSFLYPVPTTITRSGGGITVTTPPAATVYVTWGQASYAAVTPTTYPGGPISRTDSTSTTTTSSVSANLTITAGSVVVYPDATNGGVQTTITSVYHKSGGGEATTTSVGYVWPTECAYSGPPSVSLPAGSASAHPTTTASSPAGTAKVDPAAGGNGEALKSTEGNGARGVGAPMLLIGAIAGVMAIAL